MKRNLLTGIALAALLAFLPTGSHARPGTVGLGVVIGEPTGVSAKFWLGPRSALGSALAWSTENNDEIRFQMDYLRHDFGIFNPGRGFLPVYYGIGGQLRLNDSENGLGVRVPLGLDYIFESRRFDIFLEFAPVLELTPDSEVKAEAGFGARYFFH